MAEGLNPYEVAETYFGGNFDEEYDALVDSEGVDAAHKFLDETLKVALDKDTYNKVVAAMHERNQKALDKGKGLGQQAADFQSSTGPSVDRQTF